MGNRKGVMMMVRVRRMGMGMGTWMGVREWLEMGRRMMEATEMGRETGIQTGIEMRMVEKRMEMETWTQ